MKEKKQLLITSYKLSSKLLKNNPKIEITDRIKFFQWQWSKKQKNPVYTPTLH